MTPEPHIRATTFDYRHIGWGFFGLIAGAVISFAVLFFGLIIDIQRLAFSYLFAFTFFFTISIGSLFWVMVHHAVDAVWSVGVRRQMENVASLLSTLVVLFIPLIFLAPLLWRWMLPINAGDPFLAAKAGYLNPLFFWIRTCVYFAIFITIASLLRRWSVAQDEDGAARYTFRNRRVVFAGALPFAFAVTFSAIDWLMGLDYIWFSTIWGLYVFAGAILSSLAIIVLIAAWLRQAGYLEGIVTIEHFHILGKLMLAFTIFWAYIAFSQYLLVWYSNIPEETTYFAQRTHGGWRWLVVLLAIGNFFVPFLALLSRKAKRSVRMLCLVASWLLIMHGLEIYLIIFPALHPARAWPRLLDLAAFLAIGCTLGAVFLKRLGDGPLYPVRDPRLAKSITLKN